MSATELMVKMIIATALIYKGVKVLAGDEKPPPPPPPNPPK